MGSELVVHGADAAALASIVDLFGARERALSRFRPTSELSRVNTARAERVVVSQTLADAVADAVAAATATGGLVDATIASALVAAGYDRDFGDVRSCDGTPPPAASTPAGRMAEVVLTGRLLRRPPGLLLDLNGVVKGRAVDDAAALLPGPGFVSAGGDVAVTAPWEVQLPGGGSVTVNRGGMATSGALTRVWTRGGRPVHHLIDPRTGAPSTSRWAAVTVAAGSCLAADVAAKAAYLLDAGGPDWLDRRSLPGRFLRVDGCIVVNASWQAALRRPGLEAA